MILNKNKFGVRLCSLMLAALTVISCTKLDENPGEVQINPTSLSSDVALEALITGMYRKLEDQARWTGFFIAGFGGDDITTHSGSNKIGFRESDWRRQTSGSERMMEPYKGCYDAITIANTANSSDIDHPIPI